MRSCLPVLRQPETASKTSRKMTLASAAFRPKRGRGVDRGGDGRLFLILGDGGLRRLPAVDFWHGIQVISGRKRPAPRRALPSAQGPGDRCPAPRRSFLAPKEFIALDYSTA